MLLRGDPCWPRNGYTATGPAAAELRHGFVMQTNLCESPSRNKQFISFVPAAKFEAKMRQAINLVQDSGLRWSV